MRRGEIYFANLDPTIGAEINKKRPVMIISNDANNRSSPTITVLPITSNVNKIYSFEVFFPEKISGLKLNSKIQCQQIRTISKLRITTASIGKANEDILMQVQDALSLHLGFNL